jgi:PleD family two-component response regulator
LEGRGYRTYIGPRLKEPRLIASEPSPGHVLLLTDDNDASERLARWIAASGHEVVALSGSEKFLLNEGDDERVTLVVTDLDSDDPAAASLLDRLVGATCSGRCRSSTSSAISR